MRTLMITTAGLALLGFGAATATPALAGPTSDQIAAESMLATNGQAQVPNSQNGTVAGTFVGGALNPNNGLAQNRITGSHLEQ